MVKEQNLRPKNRTFSLFDQNANIAITREQLLEKVWGYDYYGDDRTLDTHMKSLRKSWDSTLIILLQ